MPWNPRIIGQYLGNHSLELFFGTGWNTESALISAAYHASKITKWSSGCRAILLLQPSSAVAEQVFSLLANS